MLGHRGAREREIKRRGREIVFHSGHKLKNILFFSLVGLLQYKKSFLIVFISFCCFLSSGVSIYIVGIKYVWFICTWLYQNWLTSGIATFTVLFVTTTHRKQVHFDWLGSNSKYRGRGRHQSALAVPRGCISKVNKMNTLIKTIARQSFNSSNA